MESVQKTISFKIDAELHKDFKRYCLENDEEMKNLIISFIKDLVKKKQSNSPTDQSEELPLKPSYEDINIIAHNIPFEKKKTEVTNEYTNI